MKLVSDEGLVKLQTRPPFWAYLRDLWKYRNFIIAEAKAKAFATGRDTFLGKIWLILDPIFQVALYAIVFGLILNVSRGIDNFIGFLIIGVIFFRMLSGGLTAGSGLIQKSRGLIHSFHFPRSALPLSSTLRAFLDDLFPGILAVIAALLLQPHKTISWSLLLLPFLYILIHIFKFGLTLIIARATAFVPDLKSLVNLTNRGLFFISGVFFNLDRFESNYILQQIMAANPIYQFLKAIRLCVLDGILPSFSQLAYLSCWSLGALTIGIVYFWLAEERYASAK